MQPPPALSYSESVIHLRSPDRRLVANKRRGIRSQRLLWGGAMDATPDAVRQTTGNGELRVHHNAEEVAAAAADLFITLSREAMAKGGRFRVALSGGSTPRRTYE